MYTERKKEGRKDRGRGGKEKGAKKASHSSEMTAGKGLQGFSVTQCTNTPGLKL